MVLSSIFFAGPAVMDSFMVYPLAIGGGLHHHLHHRHLLREAGRQPKSIMGALYKGFLSRRFAVDTGPLGGHRLDDRPWIPAHTVSGRHYLHRAPPLLVRASSAWSVTGLI